MSIVITLLLAISLIIVISLILHHVQKNETFRELATPLTLGENQGIPLTFLSSIKAVDGAFYKELDENSIKQLVSKASNILTIDAFVANINSWLPSFDKYTASIPFKVVSQRDLSSTTKQITIYRAGKLYGFVVEITVGKDATVTGFTLEQDIKVNSGIDPLGSNVRFYDTDAKEFARKDVITRMQGDISEILRKQSDALLQDRGINSLILS
jgi:hypothetical protein